MKSETEYRTVSIRPGKAISAGSFVGIIFLILFGAGFTVIVTNVLFTNDAPLGVAILFFIFMIGWMGTAVFMLVYHFLNLKRAHGVPLFEVEVATGSPEDAAAQDSASRRGSSEELKK
jgi:glycerol uptake facilitator-like aquaporin